MRKPLILIVSTANSARSQMAEGLMRHLLGDRFEGASAGAVATYDRPVRYLITVGDNVRDACPHLPAAQTVLHWPFPDPATNPRLEDFRRVRDRIREKIESTPL